MNDCGKNKYKRRFVILPVDMMSPFQIINISRKLPAHLIKCKGIAVTVKNKLSQFNDIIQLGEFSLSFNSGQVHPLHLFAGYQKDVLSNKNSFLEINEELIPNYYVTGFYRDFGKTITGDSTYIPYTLNIYLDCLTEY